METVPTIFKNIWLANDDEDDQLVFENAVKEINPSVNFTRFSNCATLLAELEKQTPDLLFLDINMPGINGKECLKDIKENPRHQKLPVIVHSGSNYHLDIWASYGYGATLYIIKLCTYADMVKTLKCVFELNWDDPQSITNNHYVSNPFVSFGAD